MSPEQFEQIKTLVSDTIKFTVNGKIDKMNTKIDEYIADDNAWKADVMPNIKVMRTMENFMSGLIYVLKFLGILGTATGIIYALINYLK